MADTTRQDTERRYYRGAAEAGGPRLAGLTDVHRDVPAPPQVLETERYDTDDHRLAAAGIALALVRDADGARWQLDLPDGSGTERLRVPVAADAPDPAPVPGEIDELLRGASRERAIRPAGRVRTVRTVTRLHDEADRVVAEVVHDEVTLATLGRSTEVRSWTEAQVDAEPELAAELTTRLAEGGLRPGEPAGERELDRLLRPAAPRRASGGKKGSAGAVLLAHLAVHVDRLDAEDLRVRRDEPDAVHQLRVASRRLRSALQAYRPLLDRTRTDPLVDGLRAFGQALAPARDAEVLHERISAGLAALEPELRLGAVEALTTRHFARTEAEARAAVLTELDGDRYARLRTDLDALLADPPLTPRAARKAAKELPVVIGRTARRLSAAVATATDPAAPATERDLAVHAARKAGKRLRYAVEVARPVVGRPAKRFASGLKGFQTALGEHQDTVVSREALRELGALAHAEGQNGFSFGVLHGRDAARAAQIEADLPQLWAAAWTRKHRRWLP